MRMRRFVSSGFCVLLLAIAMSVGCGGDDHHDNALGPGGSTISGNVATAATASLGSSRSSMLAWIGENIIGLARSAYAQVVDNSLDNITVIARGQGREQSDITGADGSFIISNAPTGDIDIVFRRGGCEAILPLGNVISTSSIILDDTDFDCPSGTGTGTATAASILETFQGVLRNEDDPATAVTQCVRIGDNNTDRDVDFTTAALRDEGGAATSFAAFRTDDLVEISGERIGSGDGFGFIADLVRILDRNVDDPCARQL